MDSLPLLLLMDIRTLPEGELAALVSSLPPLRREKLAALRDEDERRRSLAAGLLCRAALAELGLSDELVRYGSDGKPFVEGQPGLCLSLSHSGDYALCLLDSAPCAVDVQEQVGVIEAICATGYTPAERAFCEAAADRESAFFALWCRKECKAKLRPYAHLRDIDALTPEPGYRFVHFPLPGHSCAVYTSRPGDLMLREVRGEAFRPCRMKK